MYVCGIYGIVVVLGGAVAARYEERGAMNPQDWAEAVAQKINRSVVGGATFDAEGTLALVEYELGGGAAAVRNG